jgi:hypothetical protein
MNFLLLFRLGLLKHRFGPYLRGSALPSANCVQAETRVTLTSPALEYSTSNGISKSQRSIVKKSFLPCQTNI